MSICRVYPVFVAGKRIEVRLHGAMVLNPPTQAAILELVQSIVRLKQLDIGCEVADPDVPQKVQP